MALTAAGERCCKRRVTVLDERERVEKEMQECNGDGAATGVLRLSTECYTVYHWLPPTTATFSAINFRRWISRCDRGEDNTLKRSGRTVGPGDRGDPILNRRIRYTHLRRRSGDHCSPSIGGGEKYAHR